MTDFATNLTKLLKDEISAGAGDEQHYGSITGALAGALAHTIVATARGNPDKIDQLLMFLEGLILKQVAEIAPSVRERYAVGQDR